MSSTRKSFVQLDEVSFAYPLPRAFLSRFRGQPDFQPAIIRHASLQLPFGQAVTIFGPEGSGKSTLLRLLSGALRPTSGQIHINGQNPSPSSHSAGYISPDSALTSQDTVSQALNAFGQTHAIAENLNLSAVLDRPIKNLSFNQKLRFQLARATLSEAPVILADDLADHLDLSEIKILLQTLLANRTVIITTRQPTVAENLDLPLLILHKSQLIAPGTPRQLTERLACPLYLDAWIEGLGYDLIRQLKKTPGITVDELHGCDNFGGQRLRLKLLSAHYLPTTYDLLSRQPLIKTQEHPASLQDLLSRI